VRQARQYDTKSGKARKKVAHLAKEMERTQAKRGISSQACGQW